MSTEPRELYEFGPYRLDTVERLLLRDGEALPLTPKVFDTLVVLVQRSGHLVEKDDLMRLVWEDGFVEESNLTNNVYSLRKLLGRGFIETVPTRGYRFLADVSELKPDALLVERRSFTRIVTEETQEYVEMRSPKGRISTGLRWGWPILATAVAVIAVAGFVLYPRGKTGKSGSAPPFSVIDVARATSSGQIAHAALSLNGRYIALVVRGPSGDSLWIKHLDAPSQARIVGPLETEIISVAFTPDSQNLYYIALDHDKGESKMFRTPVFGGATEALAEDIYPIGFSPDGKEIAFIRMRRSKSTLVVANADGTNQKVIASLEKPDFFELEWNAPAWSPDGNTIACPASLSDGRGRYETLVAVNSKDGTRIPLTAARWNTVGQPAWLPDGSGLLLAASDRAGDPMQVWHVSLPGGATTRITHDVNNYFDLSLTNDGRRLAAVQVESVSNIWITPSADSSRAKQIGSEIGTLDVLAWTSDGRLAYRSNAGGNGSDIWIMKADGSDAKQLTVGALASRGLAVTRNGRHIVFGSDRAGRFNIWRVDTDGGDLRQLTAGDGEFYPQCTPDGRWVVFQRGEKIDPDLWKVPIEGGRPLPLSETRAGKPAVSPDGLRVAYSYLDLALNPTRWGIGIISSEGGPLLKRFDFPKTVYFRSVRWTPDGKSIAFVNNPNGRSDIWLQPLDGSPPRPLTHIGAEQILAFDWSRDGKTLSYVLQVETSDVVLIDQKDRQN